MVSRLVPLSCDSFEAGHLQVSNSVFFNRLVTIVSLWRLTNVTHCHDSVTSTPYDRLMSSPTEIQAPDFTAPAPEQQSPSLARFFARAPLVLGVLVAVLLEPFIRRQGPTRAPETVARWTKRLLRVANVELVIEGTVPRGPGLFISNHRSYIDILVILAHLPVTFLCKKEVRAWPIVGTVAEKMGVVFVDRSNAASRLASLALVTSSVVSGQRVVAFPEGTTSRAPGMRTMFPGLFREAERQRFDLFPMVIEYADSDDAWVDDDTLLRHLINWLSKPVTRVRVSFGPPVVPQGAGDSLERAQAWMHGELARLHHHGR